MSGSRGTALVAGGAGFLGSNLCERLLAQGLEIICLDNLYTGSKNNIRHLLSNDKFEFIRHDITFPIYLETDYIFNLACPASPVHYQRDPVFTLKTSIHGSINLLGLAKRTGARILQSSTSEIYGDPLISPQHETYVGSVNPIGNRACYDEGKRCAETLFSDYHRQHGVDVRIARIFNTYGPRMSVDDGRVVSNFICQALKNEPITIYGDGLQTRSFCYVDDMICGLSSLMFSENVGPKPVNLGNPNEISMLNLANQIIDLCGSTSEMVFCEIDADDPKQRKPDITRSSESIGWVPSVSLAAGLMATVEYFRQQLV